MDSYDESVNLWVSDLPEPIDFPFFINLPHYSSPIQIDQSTLCDANDKQLLASHTSANSAYRIDSSEFDCDFDENFALSCGPLEFWNAKFHKVIDIYETLDHSSRATANQPVTEPHTSIRHAKQTQASNTLQNTSISLSSSTSISQEAKNSNAYLKPPTKPVYESKSNHLSQVSRLSQAEHKLWWSTYNTPIQSNMQEILRISVTSEQALYKDSLKNWILSEYASNFVSYPEPVKLIVEECLRNLKSQAQVYHAFYATVDALEFPFQEKPRTNSSGPIQLYQNSILKVIGQTFQLPPLSSFHPIILPRTGDFFIPKGQHRTPSEAKFTFLKQTQPPVSKDSHIRRLLQKYPHDIVLTPSTMATLLDPDISLSWQIPIIVQDASLAVQDQNSMSSEDHLNNKRLTIFLDKPLVRNEMTIKEKNQKFYKMSMKRWLLQGQPSFKMDFSEAFPSNNSDQEQEKLDQSDFEEPSVTQGPDNFVYSSWSLSNFSILIRGRVDALTQTSQASQGAGASPSTSNQHVSASLNVMKPPPLSSSSPNYGIPTQSFHQTLPSHKHTSLFCKLKHAPGASLEEYSTAEKVKCAVKMHLLGDSKVLVGHVDPLNAKLLSLELISPHQFRSYGTTSSLETRLSHLHNILTWIAKESQLQPGHHYLLSHESSSPHICIYNLHKKKEDIQFTSSFGAIYDLHQKQAQAGYTHPEAPLPYLPPRWDFNRINQIPNTFPPASRSCCFAFIRNGKCDRPAACDRLHVTQSEAEARSLPTPPPFPKQNTLKQDSLDKSYMNMDVSSFTGEVTATSTGTKRKRKRN